MPSPLHQGEGHGSGVDPGNAAVKNSPAYGARNVLIVAAGTGEALPGPAICGIVAGAAGSITGNPGNEWRVGWASEAVVVLLEPDGQHNRW